MKSDQWKADRLRLREIVKTPEFEKYHQNAKTFHYVLIAHMRGKQHMRWFQKYHGGWSRKKDPKIRPIPPEVQRAYGDAAPQYYARCYLESLDAQAEWIQVALDVWVRHGYPEEMKELVEIAGRVLTGYEEEELQQTG